MPRPRKPTVLHQIQGTLDHNPQRYRDREYEPQDLLPLGLPPDTMRPDQRAAWMEIDRLAPWLAHSDRLAVEVAASLLALFRGVGPGVMAPALLSRLETMLGRLGLTPSDRSRVVDRTPKKPMEQNRFAGIGTRRTA